MPVFTPASFTSSYQPSTTVTYVLPAASGGNAPLSYALADEPSWLTFTASTRTITGTAPANATGDYEMTLTATDADGDTADLDVTLTECDGYAQGTVTYSWRQGASVDVTLPAVTCGDTPIAYSLSSTPPGLSFSASTRRLSGTVAPNSGGIYTLTATDASDNTSTLSVVIGVDLVPAPPSSITYNWREGDSVAVTLPAATGGDGALRYALSLTPPGLSFTSSTRQLSGTVAANTGGTYGLTATDADGDTATGVVIINVDRVPKPPASATYNWREGTSVAVTLPATTGVMAPSPTPLLPRRRASVSPHPPAGSPARLQRTRAEPTDSRRPMPTAIRPPGSSSSTWTACRSRPPRRRTTGERATVWP